MRAGEHRIAVLLNAHLSRKVAQELDGLIGHKVLGEVKVQVVEVVGELFHAVGVLGEPLLEANAVRDQLIVMVLQRLPSCGLCGVDRCGNVWHGVAPCRNGQHTVQGYRVWRLSER